MKPETKAYIDKGFAILERKQVTLNARIYELEKSLTLPERATQQDIVKLQQIAHYLNLLYKDGSGSLTHAVDYAKDLLEIAERLAGDLTP